MCGRTKRQPGSGRALMEVAGTGAFAAEYPERNACIAYPAQEDKYLTKDSVLFHERMGYRMVGKFQKCGYKFGRWYDMVWMEKHLKSHPENPERVIWFPEAICDKGMEKEYLWKPVYQNAAFAR